MAERGTGATIETFTAGDGYRFSYHRYLPDDPPRAQVVFLHGIQSHGGWYGYSCGRLRDAGLAVSFLDRRGSGLNEQERGDAPSFRRLVDDVAEYLRHLRGVQPGMPLVLAAISWGGKLAVALQRRHPGLVEALVLLCPGLFPKVRPPLGQRWTIVANRLVRPLKLFLIPLNDPELFTASPRWQRFIADDPLALRQATARLLVESARLDGYLRFVPKYVQVPVLLMLAGEDRIIDNTRTRRYLDRFASVDREVIEYAGAHHTLEFEPDPERFIDDLQGWMDRKTK